jgi:hypothetical protein
MLLALAGAVWFFQGVNVLPGSFMTGQTRWAVYGGITFAVGVGLIIASRRRSPPPTRSRSGFDTL